MHCSVINLACIRYVVHTLPYCTTGTFSSKSKWGSTDAYLNCIWAMPYGVSIWDACLYYICGYGIVHIWSWACISMKFGSLSPYIHMESNEYNIMRPYVLHERLKSTLESNKLLLIWFFNNEGMWWKYDILWFDTIWFVNFCWSINKNEHSP